MSAAAPNILLLMADQLPGSALDPGGHLPVRAPNLAALRDAGTSFASAYCPAPLCAPSRAGLLTGRLPSSVGVFDNACELPAETPTVAHLLRAAGYATALSGKMHFVGPDQLHGFEERLTTDVYPADFEWTPDWRLGPAERLHWYHNMASVLEAGPREFALQTDYDDEVAQRAVRWLGERVRRRDGRPFFLTVSFTNPHDPWEVPGRFFDLYAAEDVPPPRVPPIARRDADPHSRRLRDMCGIDERPLTDAEVRRARHAYLAAVSYLDERVGDVLDALARSGAAQETVVVFTTDHGEMLGERGLWYKMSFFEDSARVPLVARGPGVGRGAVGGPVSLVDVAPTLAELAGCGADAVEAAAFEGTSLAPALGGDGAVPGVAFAEYVAEGVTAPAVMVRRGRHKLVRCAGDPDRLYDLAADPLEVHDLAADGEAAEALAALRADVERRWDLADLARRVHRSQRRRRLVWGALETGLHTPWDFRPSVDASRQYVRGLSAQKDRPGERPLPGGLPGDPTGSGAG